MEMGRGMRGGAGRGRDGEHSGEDGKEEATSGGGGDVGIAIRIG
jgi:hypothetical protein